MSLDQNMQIAGCDVIFSSISPTLMKIKYAGKKKDIWGEFMITRFPSACGIEIAHAFSFLPAAVGAHAEHRQVLQAILETNKRPGVPRTLTMMTMPVTGAFYPILAGIGGRELMRFKSRQTNRDIAVFLKQGRNDVFSTRGDRRYLDGDFYTTLTVFGFASSGGKTSVSKLASTLRRLSPKTRARKA